MVSFLASRYGGFCIAIFIIHVERHENPVFGFSCSGRVKTIIKSIQHEWKTHNKQYSLDPPTNAQDTARCKHVIHFQSMHSQPPPQHQQPPDPLHEASTSPPPPTEFSRGPSTPDAAPYTRLHPSHQPLLHP